MSDPFRHEGVLQDITLLRQSECRLAAISLPPLQPLFAMRPIWLQVHFVELASNTEFYLLCLMVYPFSSWAQGDI